LKVIDTLATPASEIGHESVSTDLSPLVPELLTQGNPGVSLERKNQSVHLTDSAARTPNWLEESAVTIFAIQRPAIANSNPKIDPQICGKLCDYLRYKPANTLLRKGLASQ
jgi:hypothetical protein